MIEKISSFKYPMLLSLITILGFILRVVNLSTNKFYPDAYESLLVAQNIRIYHNVIGFLGDGGLVYPYYFAWTRPGYPLLINFLHLFTSSDSTAAQFIALITGTISIIVAYFLAKTIFESKQIAIISSLLLAISFNHVVWGGFILTETTGVLIMLLLLLSLFLSFKNDPTIADYKDIITAILIAFAVLTRYEYALIIPFIIFLIYKKSPKPFLRISNIFVTFLICLGFAVVQLFPLNNLGQVILEQVGDQISIVSRILALLVCIGILLWRFGKNKINYFLSTLVFAIIAILILAVCGVPHFSAEGIKEFFRYDFVLGIFFIIGIYTQRHKDKNVLLFLLISAITLSVIYYRIDPTIERYWTHTIPFIIFPAAYGLYEVLNYAKSKLALAVILVMISAQIIFTFSGIRSQMNGEWFRPSYEEDSAIIAGGIIPHNNDSMLIVSMPEPYFYNINLPTQSISNDYPYIYIDDQNNTKTAYIIEDAGMHEYFPNFTVFLHKNMQNYIYKTYLVDEAFHVEDRSIKTDATKDVIIYKISIAGLINILNHVNF